MFEIKWFPDLFSECVTNCCSRLEDCPASNSANGRNRVALISVQHWTIEQFDVGKFDNSIQKLDNIGMVLLYNTVVSGDSDLCSVYLQEPGEE